MKFFSCVTTLSSSFHGLPVHDNTQGIYYLAMSSEQVKEPKVLYLMLLLQET
jgi:hypothetical protein